MSQYDSTNIRVTDLALGFIFDYDLQTWEVVEEFEYDWGNSHYTKEYKITSGKEDAFISVEVDDEIELAVWKKINPLAIDRNLGTYIIKNDQAPKELSLSGVNYYRKSETLGYWRNTRTSKWEKLISWNYSDESGKKLLGVERWDEEEFEAAVGNKIGEFEISNILPREGSKRAPRDYEENKKKSNSFFWMLIIGLAFIIFGMNRCGGANKNSSQYDKKPIDELTQRLLENESFSIILYDMDIESNGWSNSYLHKYLVVNQKDSQSNPESQYTDWLEVDKNFFEQNEGNLGMELVAKKDNELSKIPSPAGWGSYVGNEQYGEWKTDNSGQTFWSFYGKYMFYSTIFNLATQPIYRNYYSDYSNSYFGRKPYYGSGIGGNNAYGTNSDYMQKSRPDFYTRRAQKNNFTSQRNSRSSSRYSSGSSYRSRGGGFGK